MSVKDKLLGMPHGTASNRLRKMILWRMVQELGEDNCFRCGQQIKDVDDLSIEHKEPWQSADDPRAVFFDLENIAFSHLRCNIGEANGTKTHCPQGHRYDNENTYQHPNGGRVCGRCKLDQQRRYDRSQRGYDRRQWRRNRA